MLILGVALRSTAQVQVGETSMNLNATVSGGYSADYSNYTSSDHAFSAGGQANLSGFYYNPNFLSFNVQPFYDQSRANSSYQSISAASGVSANAGIFGGSDYPGSVTYTRTYNSSGTYAIPGSADLVTHGDSDVFVVNWGVHREGWPSLGFGFLDSNSAFSLYGSSGNDNLNTKAFTAHAGYQLAGFNLSGGYQHTASRSDFTNFLNDSSQQVTNTGGNTYSVGIGHKLPLHGSLSANGTRAQISSSSEDLQYDTTVDSASSSVGFAPFRDFSAGTTATYIDNLDGYLDLSLVSSGVVLPEDLVRQTSSSHGWSVTSFANYDLSTHLHFRAYNERQQQSFFGISLVSNSTNGTVDYSNYLLGGQLTSSFGIGYTSVNVADRTALGLNGSLAYLHSIGRWDLKASGSYSQNTQTVLAAYTSSGYSYAGSIGRHFGTRNYFSVNASGARSLLTDQPGSANSSQTYSASLNIKKVSFNANYTKADGTAILTSIGLVTTTVPVAVINPATVVLFNGTSYGAGIGASPIRNLTISASYARAFSDTRSMSSSSSNSNENVNALVLYQFRRLNFTAGYVRLTQGFSLSGNQPTMVGSYYFGISRWFNFF
jgi:hypothetical protein